MDQQSNTEEIWKAVLGYWENQYEVSDLGRVRNRLTGYVLKAAPSDNGYPRVFFWRGRRVKFYVHALVLRAFVGDCPPGCEARHLNDIRNDNRLENLAWGTSKENKADAKRNGRIRCGLRCKQAKLDPGKVREIRRQLKKGVTMTSLARRFGVSRGSITQVRNRISWKHVPEDDDG